MKLLNKHLATGVIAISAGLAMLQTAQAQTAFGNSFTNPGSFNDLFPVAVPTLSNLESGVFSLQAIGGVTVTAFNLLQGGSTVATGTPYLPGKYWTLTQNGLPAGGYELNVVGSVAPGSGSYLGAYQVTAVPEPETYGMLLAGMGILGYIARRRRNSY